MFIFESKILEFVYIFSFHFAICQYYLQQNYFKLAIFKVVNNQAGWTSKWPKSCYRRSSIHRFIWPCPRLYRFSHLCNLLGSTVDPIYHDVSKPGGKLLHILLFFSLLTYLFVTESQTWRLPSQNLWFTDSLVFTPQILYSSNAPNQLQGVIGIV